MISYLILGLFLLGLVVCLATGHSLVLALLFGLALFVSYARYKKIPFRDILILLTKGVAKSKNILMIFVLIGMMTALWRACGTIPFIVYYGLQVVNPQFFVVSIFLLCCFVSFLIGTAFGTASTVGVICMILAKINHIDLTVAAGAVISGIFFGDRCSPMSSSASLVATLTETNLYDNIRNMTKSALIPFFLTCILYQIFGGGSAAASTGTELLSEFPKLFSLHWSTALPALLILALSLFRVEVKKVMAISVVTSIAICILVQRIPLPLIGSYLVYGYHSAADSPLVPMVTGGGLLSMLNVGLIVCISSSYFGLLKETGLLLAIQNGIGRLSGKWGRFTATLLSGFVTSAFSCNQTLATMLTYELCKDNYDSPSKFALDLENTVILVAALIPWSIAGSVPLATVGGQTGSLAWAFYLYLVPLFCGVREWLSRPSSVNI